MFDNDSLHYRILDAVVGILIFVIVVAGGTYFLQSSLIIYKQYGAHTHWAVVLIALPLIAGIVMRLAKASYPLVSALLGAMGSAAILYPQYQSLWAEPPQVTDVIIYIIAVFGIGFIATQPLRTTFMIAFRIGRYAVPTFKTGKTSKTKKSVKSSKSPKSATKAKKPASKTTMTRTQRLQASDHGNVIAMLELIVGVSSLVLSIISIFFLGRS